MIPILLSLVDDDDLTKPRLRASSWEKCFVVLRDARWCCVCFVLLGAAWWCLVVLGCAWWCRVPLLLLGAAW